MDPETRSQEFTWIDSTGELEHLRIYESPSVSGEHFTIYSCSYKYLPTIVYSWFHRARFNFKKPDLKKTMLVGIFRGDRITALLLRNLGIRYRELDGPLAPFDNYCLDAARNCNYRASNTECGLVRVLALSQLQEWFKPHMIYGEVFKSIPLEMETVKAEDGEFSCWDIKD
ncbi:hypothetical protein HDE_06219 [Halotydeus destructor]|nr:hypothetical protein HDE_06219 [Halotydeus destructor]